VGKVDPSLSPYGSLTIGYGSGGGAPFEYILREGHDVDVGFLQLFISTESVDMSCIEQLSPFGKSRRMRSKKEVPVGIWSTLLITVVERRPST
jgi:hypothetical protein